LKKPGSGAASAPNRLADWFIILKRSAKLSLVESELGVTLLDCFLVRLFKVLGQDHIPVLAHGLHASLLADALDVSRRNLFRPRNEVLEVHVLRKIHFAGKRLEDQSLLSAVWQREFYFSVQSSGPE
jgi:hypothetical protein